MVQRGGVNLIENEPQCSYKECVEHDKGCVASFTIFLPPERVVGATVASAVECCACGTAKYRLTFYGNWSEDVHPRDYPRECHVTHCRNVLCRCNAATERPSENIIKPTNQIDSNLFIIKS